MKAAVYADVQADGNSSASNKAIGYQGTRTDKTDGPNSSMLDGYNLTVPVCLPNTQPTRIRSIFAFPFRRTGTA